MILTPAQAEAVLAAMAHLNNIGAAINTLSIPGREQGCEIVVKSGAIRTVRVELWSGSHRLECERYPSQAAFAAAYGLN